MRCVCCSLPRGVFEMVYAKYVCKVCGKNQPCKFKIPIEKVGEFIPIACPLVGTQDAKWVLKEFV